MLISPVPTVCILVKDYYDIDTIEKIKSMVAKLPHFRFFISSQYTDEPKYDIYAVSDDPQTLMNDINSDKDLIKYIEIMSVNEI